MSKLKLDSFAKKADFPVFWNIVYWHGKLLTISGGKWTTARALGKQVAQQVADSD